MDVSNNRLYFELLTITCRNHFYSSLSHFLLLNGCCDILIDSVGQPSHAFFKCSISLNGIGSHPQLLSKHPYAISSTSYLNKLEQLLHRQHRKYNFSIYISVIVHKNSLIFNFQCARGNIDVKLHF